MPSGHVFTKSFSEQRALPVEEASLHSTTWTDVHKKGEHSYDVR